MRWWTKTPAWVRRQVPLAPWTTWGIGGMAEQVVMPPGRKALCECVQRLAADRVCPLVLGGGSNVLIADAGVKTPVVHLPRDRFGEVRVEGEMLYAGAAASLARVVRAAMDAGLTGLEPWAAIPGSIGGAVCMNAGSAARGIGDLVVAVDAVDHEGSAVRLTASACRFGYRQSALAKYIVTDVALELEADDPVVVAKRTAAAAQNKAAVHPLAAQSAGCVFRNPPGQSAGALIDMAGLKGARVGGAVVSERHANFILNTGGATCADVLRLIEQVRETVFCVTTLDLELEVTVWR